MSIRARIDDGRALLAMKRPQGALLLFLVAVAATARKRFPKKTTPSTRKPGSKMDDREAFETFFVSGMNDVSPFKSTTGKGFAVPVGPDHVRVETVFYKFMRCNLVHEGELPPSVHFVEETRPNTVSFAAVSPLRIGHGWLNWLFLMVARAPENAPDFDDLLAIDAAARAAVQRK
jgi:hypothetical protein